MERPSIRTEIKDASGKVTYVILAYRAVTHAEAVAAVRAYRAQHKRKPKSGSMITIITGIGASD